VRLFIAINLPRSETDRLSRALYQLALYDVAVRWGDAASLHITLKFLGEVPDSKLPSVRASLQDAIVESPPFNVVVQGLGAFPSLARPNIFWIGVSGGDELLNLQRRIDDAMAALGFESEDRPYKPHITLGRTRKDGRAPDRKVMDRMAAEFDYKCEFKAESVELMRSKLSPRGARYDVVERMELF
jgi:2'-5' RNA ligase